MKKSMCALVPFMALQIGCNSGDKVGDVTISGIDDFGQIKTTRYVNPQGFSGYFLDTESTTLEQVEFTMDNITISTRSLRCSDDNSMFQEWSQLSKAVVDAADDDGSLSNACDEITALVAFSDAQAAEVVYPNKSIYFTLDGLPTDGVLQTGDYIAYGGYSRRVEAYPQAYSWNAESCAFDYNAASDVDTVNEYLSLSGEISIEQTDPVLGQFDGVLEDSTMDTESPVSIEFELTPCALDSFDTLILY